MVSAWLLLPTFIVGAMVGVFLLALVSANDPFRKDE